MRLWSCRPIAGRVVGRLAWRWLPGYGATRSGTACEVVAEPVRRGAGQVRGHAGDPLSPLGWVGSRRLGGRLGCWRRGQYGARGARSGATGGDAGGEGLGAGSRWNRVIRRKTKRRGTGSESPRSQGPRLFLRGLREMAEPLVGPAAVSGPAIDCAPTPLCAEKEALGPGQGPRGCCLTLVLWRPVRSLGLPPPHFNKRIHFTAPDIQGAP